MITLGLDTAGRATSVALWRGDAFSGVLLASAEQAMARGHAEALLPMVRDLVGKTLGSEAKADNGFGAISKVAGLNGPGSFTGIRICMAAARGLGLAIGCPVVAVSAFEAVAHQLAAIGEIDDFPFAIAFDARRGQVYLQCFDANGTPTAPPGAVDLAAANQNLPLDISVVYGTGAPLLAEECAKAGRVLTIKPAAEHNAGIVAQLGASAEVGEPPLPLYLRRPDAKPQLNKLARAAENPTISALPGSASRQ